GGWGWGIGPGYWGFGNPYWYGGYPFWYDTLAYGTYINPYYTSADAYGGYDYGVPIQQGENQSQNPAPPQDNDYFAQARAAFYAGNYQDALKNIEHAAIDMPRNEDVHQFHALVFFALGDYQKAAAVAHTVLDTGPGWNWAVVQSFYPSPDTYTQQLRALEHAITEHGDQAGTRFLLGYEYLMLGHFKAADRQFQRVVALEPRDTLAKNILAGLNKSPGLKNDAVPGTLGSQPAGNAGSQTTAMPPTGGTSAPVQGQPTMPPNPGTASPTPAISGSWKASPAPGVTIEATLQPDKHFTWKFTEGGQSNAFSGTYTQQGDDLVLTRDQDGQKMDGVVTMNGNGGFKFRLKNADPNDLGLDFAK
ncbi:MAG TPA: tetratricopeptide repeat protein, partial [Planctomycetaceae bacterium]|nr:tetratricopeptide repeat protein [Planctomycetaceae bacterium]